MHRHSVVPAFRPYAFTPCAFAALALLANSSAPALAAPADAAQGLVEPAEIDRAVRSFTGAGIGETGGAVAPADPRLRLAACADDLRLEWHGTARAAVSVECPRTLAGSGPWRIFVATRPSGDGAPGAGVRARALPASPAIKRGDPVTVVVRGRGFSVQQTGEATESGHPGDWIGIRTARQGEPVRARIERPGLAIIPVD